MKTNFYVNKKRSGYSCIFMKGSHTFLSKVGVSKIEVKEGGEQTSVSDSDGIEKWVTDLN